MTKTEVLNVLKSLLDNLPDEVYSAERWEEGYAEAINDAIAKIKAL